MPERPSSGALRAQEIVARLTSEALDRMEHPDWKPAYRDPMIAPPVAASASVRMVSCEDFAREWNERIHRAFLWQPGPVVIPATPRLRAVGAHERPFVDRNGKPLRGSALRAARARRAKGEKHG